MPLDFYPKVANEKKKKNPKKNIANQRHAVYKQKSFYFSPLGNEKKDIPRKSYGSKKSLKKKSKQQF